MGALEQDVEKLEAGLRRLEALRPRVERAAPARDESNTLHDWAPGEILAHCAEMLTYWLGEIERVLAGSPEPVPFGRVSDDPVRTLTVDRDRTLPVSELYARIELGVRRASARLRQLDEAEAHRRGLHPRRGELTVAEMVAPFMSDHLAEHAEQLEQALDDQPSGAGA